MADDKPRARFKDLKPIVVLADEATWTELDGCSLVILLNDQELEALGSSDYRPIFKDDATREFDLRHLVQAAWDAGYFDSAKISEDDLDPDMVDDEED